MPIKIRPEYDSLYTWELEFVDKIVGGKPLTANDSSYINMFWRNKKTISYSDVKSPDTTFYYVFAKDNVAKNKLDDQNKEGRIVGYYQIGGHQKVPFDGYMEELERKEKDQRRWKISISAHDSVFNSERITGIFIDHIIHLSK